jgi:hypothetical protein
VFNALFALENGLDIAFLWSGAPLPGRHEHDRLRPSRRLSADRDRPAGGPVRADDAARSGMPTAANPLARRLVALWVAQNVFLVASSALRTIDYIDFYCSPAWRIAALAWMGLVGNRAGPDLLADVGRQGARAG